MIIGGGVKLTLLLVSYSPSPFVVNYGVPCAWFTKWFDHFMSNQWFWQVNVVNLVVDIVIWTIILLVLEKALSMPRLASYWPVCK